MTKAQLDEFNKYLQGIFKCEIISLQKGFRQYVVCYFINKDNTKSHISWIVKLVGNIVYQRYEVDGILFETYIKELTKILKKGE